MYHYHVHQWLSFFYMYCILGWCFESTYVSLKSHRFINRGFMKGPWLPLYGSGAVCVLLVTLPFRQHWYMVCLVGAIAATILEYIVGASMVAIFKVRYWDYSYRKIQLHGHICLVSTIAWGGLSLLMVYVIHDPLANIILHMDVDFVSILTHLITIAMVYDFANAFRQAMDLRQLIIQLEELRGQISARIELKTDLLKEDIENRIALLNDRWDDIQDYFEEQIDEWKDEIEEHLDNQIQELREKKEAIYRKMLPHSKHLLLHNPGSRFATLKKETQLLKERLKQEHFHHTKKG